MLRCKTVRLLAILVILLPSGPTPVRAGDDALEQFNRAMHEFNQKYYVSSGSGANQFLSETVPEGFRRGFSNFFANMGEPVVAVSSLAQGDVDNAGVATHRFFYNLIYGYGGVVDRATEAGVKAEPRDMGQAACSMGLPDGPFVVIPFYGPSTIGDFVGSVLPTLAGYVALGEMFWVYRASSRVASTMADKEGADKEGADREAEAKDADHPDSAQAEKDYQLDKEHYLTARALACRKRLFETTPPEDASRLIMPGSTDTIGPQMASVPR